MNTIYQTEIKETDNTRTEKLTMQLQLSMEELTALLEKTGVDLCQMKATWVNFNAGSTEAPNSVTFHLSRKVESCADGHVFVDGKPQPLALKEPA